jgi:hypothetical protein
MSRKAAITEWLDIKQNTDWERRYQWVRDGVAVDISAATEILGQVRAGPAGLSPVPALLIDFSIGNGNVAITSTIQTATAVTSAFLADDVIVATGATYLNAISEPLVLIARTVNTKILPGDVVTLAGTTSNDGTYEAIEVVDDDTLRVRNTDGTAVVFVAEPAAGTVAVTRVGEFVLTLTEAAIDALAFPWPGTACGDLDIQIAGESVPFLEIKRVVVKPSKRA